MAKNTHTTVHAIQFYDTKLKKNVELSPKTDFNPSTLNADIDINALVKSGAVNKIDAKAAAAAEAPADDDDTEEEGYEALTVADLKAELDRREIDYASDARKADLIAVLEADDAE